MKILKRINESIRPIYVNTHWVLIVALLFAMLSNGLDDMIKSVFGTKRALTEDGDFGGMWHDNLAHMISLWITVGLMYLFSESIKNKMKLKKMAVLLRANGVSLDYELHFLEKYKREYDLIYCFQAWEFLYPGSFNRMRNKLSHESSEFVDTIYRTSMGSILSDYKKLSEFSSTFMPYRECEVLFDTMLNSKYDEEIFVLKSICFRILVNCNEGDRYPKDFLKGIKVPEIERFITYIIMQTGKYGTYFNAKKLQEMKDELKLDIPRVLVELHANLNTLKERFH